MRKCGVGVLSCVGHMPGDQLMCGGVGGRNAAAKDDFYFVPPMCLSFKMYVELWMGPLRDGICLRQQSK